MLANRESQSAVIQVVIKDNSVDKELIIGEPMASLIVNANVLRMSNAKGLDQASRRMVLLEAAYKLFVAQIYTLCFHLLANSSAAEEATATVFMRFSCELPLRWDEARVVNRLRDLAIGEAVERLFGDVAANASKRPTTRVGAPPAPENAVARAVTLVHRERLLDSSQLKELIARLPDDLRVAFVLHDMEGLKDHDVAKHLRVRESDVRTLIRRARTELRRLWLLQS